MIEQKEIITDNLSKNISFYRRQFNLTQLELAEQLNYSDKSISKWERGEGVPDIYVIVELAKFFGVTVDQLVNKRKVPTPFHKRQQAIACFYALIAWLVATITFAVFKIFKVDYPVWHLFIYAIPVSSLIMLIFNLAWKKIWFIYSYLTVFIWTLALSFQLSFPSIENYIFYIIATPIYIFSIYLVFILFMSKKKYFKRK